MSAIESAVAVHLNQGYSVQLVSEHDDGRSSVVVGEPNWWAGSRVSFVGTPAEIRTLAMELLLAVNDPAGKNPTEGTAPLSDAGAARCVATPSGPSAIDDSPRLAEGPEIAREGGMSAETSDARYEQVGWLGTPWDLSIQMHDDDVPYEGYRVVEAWGDRWQYDPEDQEFRFITEVGGDPDALIDPRPVFVAAPSPVPEGSEGVV